MVCVCDSERKQPMRDISVTFLATASLAGLMSGPTAVTAWGGEARLIAEDTPWRVHLVCRRQDRRRRSPPTYTAPPPADWAQLGFDGSGWGRYSVDLFEAVGGYGFGQLPDRAMLSLRTQFGVSDPAKARDLKLALSYRGGVAVYVNGREIARQHLPAGKLAADVLAEAYPEEAFLDPEGNPLRNNERALKAWRDRYERRIRRLTVAVPADALRRGANVLAIRLHHAPVENVRLGRHTEWSTAGLCDISLVNTSGEGVSAWSDAIGKVTIWNATPMDTVAVTPGKFRAGFLWWGVTITPAGLARGNPFAPLQPIRTVAPRGGTCSGQVVVTSTRPIQGLRAEVGTLRHVRGREILPAEAVRVRFATQGEGESYCNGLMPAPAEGASVQPVWVLVDVPREQAPGWYVGTLSLALAGRVTCVPVQVLVSGWTVPDPKDNATLVSMYQSPDTLAEHYRVDWWSDRHFELIEKSMRSMASIGNDVLLVPVILDNYLHHKHGLVRWVRRGKGFEPEFSAMERYLDVHTKVFGKPKIVTLSIWKHDFGCRTWFRGMKRDEVAPCFVTELDPATGKMTPLKAPHFGKPGSEAFWKPMLQGVRRIVKARGGDERFVLLGEAFDSRPLEYVPKFFQKIAPGMRWQIYAHWVREPATVDGKLTALGGLETGFRINPNNGGLPEFDRDWPDVPQRDFYLAQVQRVGIHYDSSPLSYRTVMRTSGTIARIGLDFWPLFEIDGRRRSYYGSPPNEGWLWRGHCPALTSPGPEGAVRTTRGQMLLEGLQEAEVRIALVRAKQKASPRMVERIDACLARRAEADLVGKTLSQAMISMDLFGIAAREYALAAELARETREGEWSAPPSVEGASR